MLNNASGVLSVQVDNQIPFNLDLWTNDVVCGLLVNYYLKNGSHTMTLTLHDTYDSILDAAVDEENKVSMVKPVVHLTNIECENPMFPFSNDTSD